jgi:hypothetical protein
MYATTEFGAFDSRRRSALICELRHAIGAMRDRELLEWARQIPVTAAGVSLRRGQNAKDTVWAIGGWMRDEGKMAWEARSEKALWSHFKQRTKQGVTQTRDLALNAHDIVVDYGTRVVADPRSEAPALVIGVIAFLAASGGLDGDGGIPDLDLLGGIGAHRSLLTHTIVAGIVVETLARSTADLAARIHGRLPDPHDSLWDVLSRSDSSVVEALCSGVSLGLSYHFAVDATAEAGGAYTALRGTVAPAVDDLIQAGNAVVEGNDPIRRRGRANVIR